MEQNSVAERKFQTLGDVARSLLLTSGLDAYYWTFAYDHACLLSNAMPTVPDAMMTAPFHLHTLSYLGVTLTTRN